MNQAIKVLNVSRKVCSKWFRIFRFAMSLYLMHWEGITPMGGHGCRIQIDESKFCGKAKYNRGNRRTAGWVFGLVDEDKNAERRITLVCVPDQQRDSLYGHIFNNVNNGTVIVSDNYVSYHTLGYYYPHVQVNHSASFSSHGVNTNMMEGFWARAKDAVTFDGKTRRKYIQSRLDEYVVRRTFFNDSQYNFHRMLRILATHGLEAVHFEPLDWGR